ncbi:MAG: DUF2237 family protein [Akkermansiaceae bacterium]
MENTGSNKNVLGEPLIPCSLDPLTGFYRDGQCNVGPDDQGYHAICCQLTADFLAYSKASSNRGQATGVGPEWHGLKGTHR